MRNTIQDELELAKSKMIEEVVFQGKTLAKLTRDNVAIVEAMIRNDSAYIRSTDVNAAPIHNRMPLVVMPNELRRWLFQNFTSLIDRKSVDLQIEKMLK